MRLFSCQPNCLQLATPNTTATIHIHNQQIVPFDAKFHDEHFAIICFSKCCFVSIKIALLILPLEHATLAKNSIPNILNDRQIFPNIPLHHSCFSHNLLLTCTLKKTVYYHYNFCLLDGDVLACSNGRFLEGGEPINLFVTLSFRF